MCRGRLRTSLRCSRRCGLLADSQRRIRQSSKRRRRRSVSSPRWRSVMRDYDARSRNVIAATVAGLLAMVVIVFGGSVEAQDSPRIGIKVRTLSAELRKQHNLGADVKGALVTGVTAGSPAQE